MAKVTNPQLKDYANGRLRVVADLLTRIDMQLTGLRAEYDAKNLGTVIEAAGAAGTVDDGADQDGRTLVTGGDVYNLMTLLDELKAFIDDKGRREVIYKWQVNGAKA